MLTGMDQRLLHAADSGQRSQDRSSVHEIGASSNDVKNVHVRLFPEDGLYLVPRDRTKIGSDP